jgi:SAM-dependent methyltransferase
MSGRDDWDDHWDRYAKAASRNPGQVMRQQLTARLLGSTGLDKPGARLLDIGSGQGDLITKLRPVFPQAEMIGLEMSCSGVEISRRKVPNARFLVADLFQPPAELQSLIDWGTHAVCSEVLEHVDSPEAFLRAARPYLAVGARLIVTVPGGPMSAFEKHIGHRQHFNRASISRALREGGFETERVYLSGFPFFNLFRWTVFLRGKHVETDVAAENRGPSAMLATFVMAIFRGLFRLNLMDHRWGWQVIAIGRKKATSQ